MAVNTDCLHYLEHGMPGGSDTSECCRVDMNESDPFACPEGCLFYDFGDDPNPWEHEVLVRTRMAAGGREPPPEERGG